jgi:hypothetical protein
MGELCETRAFFKKASAYFSDLSSFPGLAVLASSQNIDALITGSARKQHDIIGRYPVPSSLKSRIERLFESV